MKKVSVLLLLLSFTLLTRAQADEAAIKDVSKLETEAFGNRDAKKMISYWHVVPQTTMFVFLRGERIYYKKAGDLTAENMQKAMGGTPFKANVDRSEWNFCINDATAYVTFEQTSSVEGQGTTHTHETRFMQKVSGEWKIVSSNVIFKKE